MRIAYHIQSHKHPEQVVRLVDRLHRSGSGESVVLVSHQVGGERLDEGALSRCGETVVLPSHGGYGDFSHIERYVESLRWLLARDDRFTWFVNLTGQDYPVVPMRTMERELATGAADAWFECYDVRSPASPWPPRLPRTRYEFRYWRWASVPSPTWTPRLRPLAAVNRLQPWVRFSPEFAAVGVRRPSIFDERHRCYGGSFYGAANRRALQVVLDSFTALPAVVDHFRHSLAPEEAFLQTVLRNADGVRLEPRSRRYFDFSAPTGNHPKVLGIEDLDAVRASNAWFARKTDGRERPEIMDALDRLNGWD